MTTTALLSFDTDRIKDYVFASDALRDIRGASSILDDLNRVRMRALVGGECAFASGGGGLFAVPAADADALIARVRRAYSDATGGAATITGVALPLPEGFDLEQSDIRPLWRRLGHTMAAQKSRTPLFRTSISHSLLRYADGTSGAYAAVRDTAAREQLISLADALKRKRNRTLHNLAHPEDFDAIAEGSTPSGYFALLVADGDNMGRVLEACATFRQIGAMATALEETLQAVLAEATTALLPTQFDRLLLGGDDVELAVPAQYGLPVALTLAQAFPRRIKERTGKELTLSVAVVWAHMRFPFAAWRELAESTLQFTKQAAALRGLPGGLINFLVVSSANHLRFKDFYADHLVSREPMANGTEECIERTLRPYSPEMLQRLIEYRTTQLAHMPRSKLAALQQAVFRPSSRQAMLDALHILVQWRGQQPREAIQQLVIDLTDGSQRQLMFPFIRTPANAGAVIYRTPLADLAELWDFIPGGSDADGVR